MSGLRRTVHIGFDFRCAPVNVIAPDLGIEATRQTDDGGAIGVELTAVEFVDQDDGERHVYIFDPEGRANLVRKLTGGVIVPG